MNSIAQTAFTFLLSFAALRVHAEAADIFVSCYPADGSNLMIEFSTAETKLIYRHEKGTQVEAFESSPSAFGRAHSAVTAQMSADHNHMILKAQIIGGDSEQPVIETSAQLQFDRTDAGLQLTSQSFYHLDQQVDLTPIQAPGTCYVQ